MPRRKQEIRPDAGAAGGPFLIDPNGIYRPAHVNVGMGLPKSTLRREMRLGRLRFSMRSGKVFILGSWLLSWIEAGEIKRRPRSVRAASSAAIPDTGPVV